MLPDWRMYLVRLALLSLSAQPLMSIAELVVLKNSIQSEEGALPRARISLMTIAPGLIPGSATPGPPSTGSLGRQPSLSESATSLAFGSIATSDQPSPSVWGYQLSL